MRWLASWESFVRVVEEGSMAAAARRLDCTRAQVSKQVGELEQAFGVRLFERSTRKLVLTPSGEIFHRHALQALDAVNGAELAVRNVDEVPRGVLRLGASAVFGRQCVAPFVPRLLARYPELECELILSDERVDFADASIDLALRMTKSPPEDVVSRLLLVLRRVICASPAYLAAHGRPQQPADLAAHQCFSHLLSDGGMWRLRDGGGNELSVPIHSRLRFNDIGSTLDAVRAGQGIAILPTYLCGDALAQGELETLLDAYEPQVDFGRNLYACYLPSRGRLPAVRAFLGEFQAWLSPEPPWERYGRRR